MVQITTTSTESSKNRTDLVRVKGKSKEDGRSWLELVHRSWCYKAGQCRSWPWGLSRQWTVHASSYQHCRPQLFFHLRRLKSVRRILGAEITSGLMSAFVTTRLDYCNSVLAGPLQSTIDPLQRVQNSAARLVAETKAGPHHSSPPAPTLASDQVPQYLQALRACAPGASWSQPCVPVGHDIRRWPAWSWETEILQQLPIWTSTV